MIFDASCWLVRSYLEEGDHSSAEVQLEELLNIKNVTKKTRDATQSCRCGLLFKNKKQTSSHQTLS